MNEFGIVELKAEAQQITDWLKSVDNAWDAIETKLKELRSVHVESLINEENAETRGRIKQIDDVLSIPGDLRIRFNEIALMLSRPAAADGGNPLL